ncbi:FUSC family protein [Actinopolyspora saharensis]|uniref:FUSC family protein n=1 Tax=Actinopolyspora saharensis TaxID=995062 RepID=UPI003F66C087
MANSLRDGTRQAWDRIVASDPGLNRLRLALSGVLAVGTTLLVEYGLGLLLGAGPRGSLVVMLLGAVVGMMGAMALTGSQVWPKIRTAVFFPVAIGVGMVPSMLTSGHHALRLTLFVAMMFAAVFVRRFGMAFFFYGFMAWMGYFFTTFLGATPDQLPTLLLSIAVATVTLLVLSTTVLRVHVGRTLRRTLSAFRSRGRAVAATGADILAAEEPTQRMWRRLHGRQVRLAEAALMVEGWLGEQESTPRGRSATGLRRQLIDAQLAVEGVAASVSPLTRAPAELRAMAARTMRALATSDHEAAVRAARELRSMSTPDEALSGAVRQLAASVQDFVAIVRDWTDQDSGQRHHAEEFAPAVTLAMGNLPGSAAVAGGVPARGSRWNPLSRLDLNTRQAIQVTVAGALAVLAGLAVSPTRYYWAAIAAFVVFTGASTRSETSIKAVNRVVGTCAGLFAALWLARLTAGNTPLILAVILACIFCGFYLMRVSYALMIFFITILVGQLYTVLNQLSDQVMLLRLEETAVGAASGILVSLVVVPLSTRDTVRSARASFFTDLAVLLRAAAHRLGVPDESRTDENQADEPAEQQQSPDGLSRVLDQRLQQIQLIADPLTRHPIGGNDVRWFRHRLVFYTACASYARQLAAGLRHVEPDYRVEGAGHACGYLAAVADALAEHRPDRTAPGIDRDLSLAGRALEHPTTPATEPVRHSLSRLHQVLYQLAVPGDMTADPHLLPEAETTGGTAAHAGWESTPDGHEEHRGSGGTGLHGVVRDTAGDPLPHAVITVIGTHGQQLGRIDADDRGTYAFPELPADAVTVVTSAAGFVSDARFAPLPVPGRAQARHDFTLAPTAARERRTAEHSGSGPARS